MGLDNDKHVETIVLLPNKSPDSYINVKVEFEEGKRGCILIKDAFYDESGENEYIKDYGMAYIDGDKLNRAIGVFVIDLARLAPVFKCCGRGLN